ncbi:MAG: hypothetical protein GY952_04830 [Rhodobacteraceae bacterium]|nr:hypothetical protein [Paracoccaceae bacterium]
MPTIVATLKTNPLKFLKVFPIKISTTGASRVVNTVSYGQKTMSGMMGGQTVLMFTNSFTQFNEPSKTETCKAHIVQAAHGAPQFYTLSAECDFMLTTELSGCCMVLDRSVNPPRIAHCWPDKAQGEDGNTVQTSLEGNPNRKLYGKKNYIEDYSYVVGVRSGAWRFFAQERPKGGAIGRALEILV